MSKRKQFEDIELAGKVIVSDPCYTRETWCAGELNIKPGHYKTFLQYGDEGRVAELVIIHSDVDIVEEESWELTDIHVGVDSGQAGIFCDSIYPHGNTTGDWGTKGSFYHEACEATLGEGYENIQSWARLKDSFDMALSKDKIALEFHMKVLEDMSENFESCKKELDLLKKGVFDLEMPEWNQGGTIFGKGFVSGSGYGDGSYSCLVIKEDEVIVAVKILFIGEDEEEEYEEFEEE